MKALDLSGKVFGKLTAVEKLATKPIKWLCKCSCGNTSNVLVSNLTKKVNGTKSCGCAAESAIKIVVGESYNTDSSGIVKVVRRAEGDFVVVTFEDGTEVSATQGNLRAGKVRNPNLKVAFGIGYNGIGEYRQHGVRAHSFWYKMMQRAYCPAYKAAHPTYEDVTVSDEWHNYQNFAEWCSNRPQYSLPDINLDKDILVRGNKVYSPETCSLVPQHINKVLSQKSATRELPIGVVPEGMKYIARCMIEKENVYLGLFATAESAGRAYVKAKEKEVKRVAEEYKDILDTSVYEALMKYTLATN